MILDHQRPQPSTVQHSPLDPDQLTHLSKASLVLLQSQPSINVKKQDHLRMNVAPDLNNHLRSIDLFRSMIIKKNRSKVRDSHWIVIGYSSDSHRFDLI